MDNDFVHQDYLRVHVTALGHSRETGKWKCWLQVAISVPVGRGGGSRRMGAGDTSILHVGNCKFKEGGVFTVQVVLPEGKESLSSFSSLA
jgi:hypothetical protein